MHDGTTPTRRPLVLPEQPEQCTLRAGRGGIAAAGAGAADAAAATTAVAAPPSEPDPYEVAAAGAAFVQNQLRMQVAARFLRFCLLQQLFSSSVLVVCPACGRLLDVGMPSQGRFCCASCRLP